MLEAKNIQVSLGRKPILRGVDFIAKAGELTSIIGPNGSGKTTLLRALTQELPFQGRVSLAGQDIATLKPWELALRRAVLPQATNLAFPFTVIEVVQLGLTAGRNQAKQRDHLPLEALAAVGLAGFGGRFYQELSGGEQQRVQLARVLVQVWDPVVDGKPCWLFLDEPVSSLDIGHQLEIMQLAREFTTRGGGVIAVMHDLNLTAMFADKMALLHQGHIIAQDTPQIVMSDELLSRAYSCDLHVNAPPPTGGPFLLPQSAGRQ